MLNYEHGKAILGQDARLSIFAKTLYEERIEKKE